MKKYLLAGSLAALIFTSCSTSRNTGSTNPYPQPSPNPSDPNPYPYPNGGDQSRTYPYPQEGQKDGNVTIINDGRDGNGNYENLPPGQAKKKYGGKSAKVYAPGQRKKNGENYDGAPRVISVPDHLASRSTSGQLFYNYRSNTYWKQNDGYYHLQGGSSHRNTEDSKKKDKSGKNKGKKG